MEGIEHTVSSGNVFADLGLPEADRLLEEADRRITERIERQKRNDGSSVARQRRF